MRIFIIHVSGSPLKAYLHREQAVKESERLRDLDDFVDYSLIDLPVEPSKGILK